MFYVQESHNVLTAAELNNVAVVFKWVKDISAEDADIRHTLVQILHKAAQCLSVDVITIFELSSKKCINKCIGFEQTLHACKVPTLKFFCNIQMFIFSSKCWCILVVSVIPCPLH